MVIRREMLFMHDLEKSEFVNDYFCNKRPHCVTETRLHTKTTAFTVTEINGE